MKCRAAAAYRPESNVSAIIFPDREPCDTDCGRSCQCAALSWIASPAKRATAHRRPERPFWRNGRFGTIEHIRRDDPYAAGRFCSNLTPGWYDLPRGCFPARLPCLSLSAILSLKRRADDPYASISKDCTLTHFVWNARTYFGDTNPLSYATAHRAIAASNITSLMFFFSRFSRIIPFFTIRHTAASSKQHGSLYLPNRYISHCTAVFTGAIIRRSREK